MKNERMGMLIVGAALAVVIVTAALVLHRQSSAHRDQSRAHGVGMVRILSSLPYEQLVPAAGRPNPLQALVQTYASTELGYGMIEDARGMPLVSAGAVAAAAPRVPQPQEPASWYGERQLTLEGDGRPVREFYGPVLDKGQLVGQVRVAFYEAPSQSFDHLPFLAMLALPVFLLAPMFYFLLKREFKPLAALGGRLASEPGPELPAGAGSDPAVDAREFIQRLARYVEATQARAGKLEAERTDSLAANRMLSYRQEKLEAVLHAMPLAILVLDESGCVTFASPKLAPLLGIDAAALQGRSARDAIEQPELGALLARCVSQPGHAPRAEALEFSPPGEPERRIAADACPLYCPRNPDSATGTLLAFRDVSAERLARRAGAEFVSHVAHELKSPLNTLTMYSELLLGEAAGDEALRIEAVNVVRDETERMATLVNNLLSIARIETGSVALERDRVRLHDLLQDTFESVSRNAKGKDIDLRLELPRELTPVLLDKDLFRIALANLLTNAIKYNRPQGTVTLQASESDSEISIRVRDSGIGIAPQDQARVFEKFYRSADAEAVKRGGHGLGLHLVKLIVELHHGSVAVASEPGQWTEFSIALKKSAASLQETARL